MSQSKNNVFTSKSNVLKLLKNKLKKSYIEEIYYFTILDWTNNENKILNDISKQFKKTKIIIRSSAIGEDSNESSQAGNFDSILNINSSSKKNVKKSIQKVIQSYKSKGNENTSNQILIQKQTLNVHKSGVVFSRVVPNGAPYYVINFEIGDSTEGVTQGKISNTVKIFRKTPMVRIPDEWKKLIISIREIEILLKNSSLDIEFAITQHNVVIFQVRPLVTIPKINFTKIDNQIEKIIIKNKKYFQKLKNKHKTFGSQLAFSDMTDWNPSEIIGTNPHTLDYSLYFHLIMNDSWSKGRTILGYQDLENYPLMQKFGNKPYVDIRASFNSLIPSKLSKPLKEKLFKYYFEKLCQNHHLHDKVEFEILLTCYDFNIESKLKELHNFGFTKKDIQEIRESLIIFTRNIVNHFENNMTKSEKCIAELSKIRLKMIPEITPKASLKELQKIIGILFTNCKSFGTIHFSTMARIAFISSILLRSMDSKKFGSLTIDNFMQTISTPLTEIQNDINLYKNKKITKNFFLKKYGHLRPGTYDITMSRYDKDPHFFEKIAYVKPVKKSSQKTMPKIYSIDELNFQKIDFLNFVKISLVQREVLKFEFTKNLSDILEVIAIIGEKLGISRNDISNLDIMDILNVKQWNKKEIKNYFKKKILKEENRKSILDYFILPPLIFSEHDFEIIQYYISKPNFISTKKVSGNIFHLDLSTLIIPDIENKIVLIENADPGFDWIFSKNPLGLITKFGGTASHMAIRCSELNLPAAIGCGEILYEKLLNSSKIILDCNNVEITILDYLSNDKDIEIRKTLKSLGYIK